MARPRPPRDGEIDAGEIAGHRPRVVRASLAAEKPFNRERAPGELIATAR